MIRKIALVYLGLCLFQWATPSLACFAHMYGNSGAAMVHTERVFNISHPSMAIAPVGKESEILIRYKRPLESRNVSVELAGAGRVEILDDRHELRDPGGSFVARFRTPVEGLGAIQVIVQGEYNGESVLERSTIWVRAKKETPEEDLKVTAR